MYLTILHSCPSPFASSAGSEKSYVKRGILRTRGVYELAEGCFMYACRVGRMLACTVGLQMFHLAVPDELSVGSAQ